MTTRRRTLIGRLAEMLTVLFGIVAVWPAIGFVLAGGWVLVWQCLQWLATAQWTPMPLRDALVFFFGPHTFLTGALGLDKIVQYLLDNTSMVPWLMFVAPLLWFWFWAWVFNSLSKWAKWVRESEQMAKTYMSSSRDGK